jgi:hypothetical protein
MDEELKTWAKLNEAVQSATEEYCRKLLHIEISGKRRKQFMLRIHSRLNKVRAQSERLELIKLSGGSK